MDSQLGESSTLEACQLSSKIQNQFANVFKIDLPTRFPPCRNVKHRLKLVLGTNLVSRMPYIMILKEENEVWKVVDEYLGKGLIRPSFFPFALLVLLVKKKDG